MVRKQVRNLRGLVLTPEELDVILPIVETSKKMNIPEHDSSVTRKLLKECYYKYYVWYKTAQKQEKLYGTLSDMAKGNPEKLLSLWDKVLNTRKLSCPEDIDEELLVAFDVGSPFKVYNEIYRVDRIDCVKDNTVTFKRDGE